MKKLTALVISVALAFGFTGCASRSDTSNTNEVTTTVTATTTSTPKATTVTTSPTTSVATTTLVTTETTAKTKSTTTMVKETTAEETTAKTTTTAVSTTTTETKTTVKKVEPVNKRIMLYVKNIQQLPELPMGCEAVSGSIALQWYGFKVDKFTLLEYQPMMEQPTKDGVWGDPNKVFVGNPRTHKWGCYSPVIKKAIEDYFKANMINDYEVVSLNGSKFTDLYQEIDDGNPIILWVTTRMQNLEKGDTWKLEDGSSFTWTLHEHCVCLIGYDTENDTVIISDPYDINGTVEYPRKTVEKVYKQLNNMALVIHKK